MDTITFQSGGKQVRLVLSDPEVSGKKPAILLLHGAGGNVGFWLERIASAMNRLGIAVFAVHYFDRTGTSFAGPALLQDGVHVPAWLGTVRDAVAVIKARPGVDAERVGLVGISLGGFLAMALGAEDPVSVRCLAEISGGLASQFAAAATGAFPTTLLVHGDSDTVVPVSLATEAAAALSRLGVAHELQILPGEGHWFSGAGQVKVLRLVVDFLTRWL